MDRFWSKVQYTPGCWLWTASKNDQGYGGFRVDGRTVKAHRFAYELLVGPIPEGLTIDHLCRVRHCINPDHMEPVTLRENNRRIPAESWGFRQKDFCKRGHDMLKYRHTTKSGAMYCNECNRIRAGEHRARVLKGQVSS